jgi:hypothetical protein
MSGSSVLVAVNALALKRLRLPFTGRPATDRDSATASLRRTEDTIRAADVQHRH